MNYDPKHNHTYNESDDNWSGYPDRLDMSWFLKRHPNLGELGYGDTHPLEYLEIRRVMWWLIGARKSAGSKGKWTWWNSYYLKHVAEKALGDYIANGTFIAAALLAGCKTRRLKSDSFNCEVFLPDLTKSQPWTDQDGVDPSWRERGVIV
jgi:hypothetical protein